MRFISRFAVTLAAAGACSAQVTIHVPADKVTIQAAIIAASNGDTILVSPGTYRERIDFSSKAITVKSVSGPDATIIDGGQAGPVVSFIQREGLASILQGFTIQNGLGGTAGGIFIQGSSPSILANRIVNNAASSGAGIGIDGGSPLIQRNTISNNIGPPCRGLGGGGIAFRGDSTGRVLNNIISGNSAADDGGGVCLFAGGAVTIRDNVISGNTAGGFGGGIAAVNTSPAIIVQNLIVDNKAGRVGGVSLMNPPGALINNTIAGNQSIRTAAPSISGLDSNFSSQPRVVGNLIIGIAGQSAVSCGSFVNSPIIGPFRNNDVFSPGGAAYFSNCVDQTGMHGNLSSDPKFIDPGAGNYRLQPGSPAIDAGDPAAPELGSIDLDGNPRLRSGNVDIGAYESPGPTTATLSATSLIFSQQAVGTSSAIQTVTIRNTGSAPLQISSIVITGDFSETTTCYSATAIAPGAGCNVAVTFAPTARGTRTGTLTVVSNASGSGVVALSGSAIAAVASLSASTLTFPNQAANSDSAAQPITVTNTGDFPLTITDIAATAEFVQTNTCTAAIAPAATCSIAVTFHPIASGARTGTLTIASNAPGSPQIINLAGNGVAPVPALSSISPVTVSTAGPAFTLTVQGSGFLANSVVRWNGQDRPTTFASAGQLTAVISASDLTSGGSFPITVFNAAPGGGSSNAINMTVGNLVPSLTSLSPASALVGGSGFQLTVNGSNFVPESVVRWNGNDRATTFVSPAQLRAAITATDISIVSSNQVTVFNPAPGGGVSGSLTFSALVSSPVPSLTAISPSRAAAGDPAFTLAVSGSGFVSSSIVQWNGSSRPTTFVNETQLQAAIPTSDLAVGGTAQVTVFNPAPGGGTSAAATFTIAGNAVPNISSITPDTITGGGPAITLTVNGAGFSASSVVRWNGQDRPTTFVSSVQLTAAIPASDTASAGTARVTVFNPPPGGGTAAPATVTIVANTAPGISNLVPSALVAGTASQAINIVGGGFNSTSVVRWNGQDRPSKLIDASTLTVQLSDADLAAPGIAEIRVFNPPLGGGSSTPFWFATTIALSSNSLVYDKTRGLLYVSLPSSQGKLGNSVVSIDPTSGALGQPIFVGSEPGKLAISDDGQYLYVSLTSAAAVRRVDLKAQIADLQFELGSEPFNGPLSVDDMAVMPGKAHALAVSRRFQRTSPRHAGVAIYDDGVIRKNVTPEHNGGPRIEFSSSPDTIYSFDNETSDFGFRILSVDSDGVRETKVFKDSKLGGFGADIKYDNGRIYSTAGAVLNPDTGALTGTFRFAAGSASGVAPESARGRIFFSDFLGPFAGQAGITVYDNSTFAAIGALHIPGLITNEASPGGPITFADLSGDDLLVRWGDDGMAFRGPTQMFLFRSAMVKPPAISSDAIVSAASFAAGPVAPGSLTSLFGLGLTAITAGATSTPLPASLGGVGVFINGAAAPLFYASPNQINFQVPWELAGKPAADISVEVTGFSEKSVKLNLSAYSPGIFTLGGPNGQGVVVIAGTATLAAPAGFAPGSRPANRGEFLSIYCTGLGPVNNQPPTGSLSPGDTLATTTSQPVVMIGGQPANVSFSGLTPGLVGVYQVNVQVPASSAPGDAAPLVLNIGGAASNTVTIAVR